MEMKCADYVAKMLQEAWTCALYGIFGFLLRSNSHIIWHDILSTLDSYLDIMVPLAKLTLLYRKKIDAVTWDGTTDD
ncbi:hypothetical protein K1719_030119 [Acacia pycnantha]|nr:hypothetical protein K1719_030119 [Acacia pycnantha]